MDFISSNQPRRSKNYDRIKRLAMKLQEPGNVKERRRLALELEQLMSSYDVRVALADEATPTSHGPNDLSVAATRCLALSTLWTTVFTAAIGFTTGIIKGENGKKGVKPTPADIGFPDKLLRAATGPDQVFDAHGIAIPKLNRKTVRSIVKFCLEMLDNDKVIECGGEAQMLEMLARICSRTEYLGLVKDVRFQIILSEITCRLTEQVSADIFLVACKAFDAFFETCGQLGHPVHSYLSDCLSIVGSFCRDCLQQNSVNVASAARMHMFNAAASMLFSHPEYAVGPIKRDGRHILRFCKKGYENASPNHREAFNRYLLAHLFVAQVAGVIQGRLTGDLGDLGDATLSEKQLTDLLRLVVGSTSKILEAKENNAGISDRRAHNQKNAGQAIWKNLDMRQKLHLELGCRLLACSQRHFLAREGGDKLSNEKLESLVEASNPTWGGDEPLKRDLPEHPRLSLEVLSRSPWMSIVLRGLVATSQFATPRSLSKDGMESSSTGEQDSVLSVINLLKDGTVVHTNESPVPYLAIVAACCECFPSGQCWASSPAENWNHFMLENDDIVHIHACSPSDLGLLLHVLSEILEFNGSPVGDPFVQSWILLCLTKIAETTPLTRMEKDYTISSGRLIVQSWRRIWKVLFRKDLRYCTYTGLLGENSIEELIFILMTEMIRWKCTESLRSRSDEVTERQSSFVFKNQHDLWSLELFSAKAGSTPTARSPFELVSVVARAVGLSELSNRDTLDMQLSSSQRSLRQRLVHFLLRSLEDAMKGNVTSTKQGVSKSRLFDAISVCLVTLSKAVIVSTTALSSQDPRFSLTTLSDRDHSRGIENNHITSLEWDAFSGQCLAMLWSTVGVESHRPTTLSLPSMCRTELDASMHIAASIRTHLQREENKIPRKTWDFVSEQESDQLENLILKVVGEKLSVDLGLDHTVLDGNDDDRPQVDSSSRGIADEVRVAKLLLSIAIARGDYSSKENSRLIETVLYCFEKMVKELCHKKLCIGDYFTLSVDLRKLADVLMELKTRSMVDLDCIASAEKSCQVILRRYKDEVNKIEQLGTSMQHPTHESSNDMRFSDDEDVDTTVSGRKNDGLDESDSENSYNNKRKSPVAPELGRKRRKKEITVLPPPSCDSAFEVGRLLLVLNPTRSNANLVIESLLRTELDLEPDSVHGDMDLRLAEACVHLLGTKNVLLNSSSRMSFNLEVESENPSIVIMLCRVIDLTRACATSNSNLFMFGIEDCSQTFANLNKMGLKVSDRELKEISDILYEESDAYFHRPALALKRLLSTTHAFKNGSEAFRDRNGLAFAAIVKKGMSDGSFLVRRFAFKSAGVAMRALNEHRVLKSIQDIIPPIFERDKSKSLPPFSSWFSQSPFAELWGQHHEAVDDACEVLESDSIFARMVIAGSTQEPQTFFEFLFELLATPVNRPALELLCFRALERVACVKNYKSVQELVELEAEALLAAMFRRGEATDGSTRDYSLCFTGPLLVEWLAKYGQYKFVTGTPLYPWEDSKGEDLRSFAMGRFLSAYRGFLVPFLLVEHCQDTQMFQSLETILERFSSSPKFRILLAVIPQGCGDHDNIKKLLKKHAIDVLAFCAPMLQSDDRKMETTGKYVQKVLCTVLSEDIIKAKTLKNLPQLIRRIVALLGKSKPISTILPSSDEPYYRAIRAYLQSVGQPAKTDGDDFLRLGTSLTEMSIYSSRDLGRSNVSSHQSNNWSQFQILGRFLVDQIYRSDQGENMQLSFFLHTLTEILLKNTLEVIRPKVLQTIHDILHESLKLEGVFLKTEVSASVQRLLAVCFHIHEGYQVQIVQFCREKSQKARVERGRSCGIALSSKVEILDKEREFSDFKNALREMNEAGIEANCLVATYDVIQWVVSNKGSFGLDPYIFESLCNQDVLSESDLDALSECDVRFCAQRTTADLESISGCMDILPQCVMQLAKRSKSPHAWVSEQHRADAPGTPVRQSDRLGLNTDQRLLHAELLQIEKLLGDVETNGISSRDMKSLSDGLLSICNAPCPTKIKFAASRCIGALKPNLIVEGADLAGGNELVDVDSELDLISVLQAKCVECLGESLKSSQTEVSSTAMAILKGILSTNLGKRAYNLTDESSKSLLQPFVDKPINSRSNLMLLSRDEILSLLKTAGVQAPADHLWCWNSHMWEQINEEESSFEDWICSVTTSIILCCCKDDKENSERVQVDREVSDFFWRCQKGTFLDHRFASAVFPSLILAILDIKNNSDKDFAMHEGNKAISRSFELLLKKNVNKDLRNQSARAGPRYRAVSLILDTIDLARKICQKAFLLSWRKPTTPRKAHHPVPWEGIPYGIVMQLDGIQVASACIEVQRFPAALFFLDLYLNAQFGKAGGLFEDLSNGISYRDILGLYNDHQQPENASQVKPESKCLKVMAMAYACFTELHEEDEASATKMQLSSLTLMDDVQEFDNIGITEGLDGLSGNVFGSHTMFENSGIMKQGVVDALQQKGLNRVIQGFIEGLSTQHSGLQNICQEGLVRERWFESNLDLLNWDKLRATNVGGYQDLCGAMDQSKDSIDMQNGAGFFESVSKALMYFSRDDLQNSSMYIRKARLRLVNSVIEIGGEHAGIEDVIATIDKGRALRDLENLINGSALPLPFDYAEADALAVSLGMRQVTLATLAAQNPGHREFLDALRDHLWTTCQHAVDRSMPSTAENALIKLRWLSSLTLKSSTEEPSFDAIRSRFEGAKVLECRGDFTAATQRMKQLVGHLLPLSSRTKDPIFNGILTDAELLCAHWMTKYKTQHARVILETYLQPAVDRAKQSFELKASTDNANQLTRGSIQLGNVLANLFDGLLSRIHSIEWKEAGERLEDQQQQLQESLQALPKSSKAKESVEYSRLNRTCVLLKAENEKIEKERNQILDSIPRYLRQSIESFIVGLKASGTASEDLSSHIFRMVSLWFASHEEGLIDEELGVALASGLCEIPSYRFVPLTNQLFSRLEGDTSKNNLFQRALQNLVQKMCDDHPYHCLAPLIALSNGNLDEKGSLRATVDSGGDSKVTVSKEIMNRLRKSALEYVAQLVESYEILITAYNDTAYADVTALVNKKKTKKVKFSELIKTSKAKLLDQCLRNRHPRPCVLTSPPFLRSTKDYGGGKKDPEGGEIVNGFEPIFDLTDTGIHRPKIVTCLGSKGGRFRQLVKGEDDLRQDAIMSQIFTYVNVLMTRDERHGGLDSQPNGQPGGSRRGSRKINIATYNILPLSPMSGVLEWVQNTMPMMNFIDGVNSAHSRYYPHEWDYRMCARHMKGDSPISKKGQSREERFRETCERYSPCFRFFFLERFSESAELWHTARTKYTRSVAVNSIVGHILGIGDRHLSNILIHTKTGVVVHIDFGVVFEQGKLLPVPELVPFRLTRNIVDGMGPCGTEGIFNSTAKETMSTLRKNARDLLTILSAVVADPLYRWQTDHIEARRRQTESDDDVISTSKKRQAGKNTRKVGKETATAETNTLVAKYDKNQAAIKTIEKIKHKLEGYEDSTFGDQQGVEGQVQLLVNSARDTNLLKEMYVGWAAWM